MSSLSIAYSRTASSITLVGTLNVTYGGSDMYVKYTITETGATKDSGTITLGAGESGSVSAVTFSGLSSGTTYTITGKIYNNADQYTGVGSTVSVTTISTASYSVSSYDHESATLYISGVSVGSIIRVFCRYYDDTSSSVHDQTFTATQTSFRYTITGLEPETKYIANVGSVASVSSGSTTWWGGQSFTTSAKPSVAEWDWTISNGDATADQTYTAYRAMTELSDCWWIGHFHYKVWNDLVNKAYEVITDRGGTWNTTYGTLAETLLSASDTEITSSKLNAVWWNLSQYVTTGLSKMSAGDELTGDYFVTLAEAINNAIWRG